MKSERVQVEMSAVCLLFLSAFSLHFQLFVYNLNFSAKMMFFRKSFVKMMSSKLEMSALCLHVQLFIYFCQLFVYFCELFL